MSKDIRIRKGLDIKLVGSSEHTLTQAPYSAEYAIVPDDFHLITPRLLKRAGDKVEAGEGVFCSKQDTRIVFPSPVNGTVKEIRRGAKRKILSIVIEADTEQEASKGAAPKWKNAEELKSVLCEAGCWPFIKQRPYDVIANPDATPKAIYVSAYNSAPIAAEVDQLLQGKEQFVQTAVDALQELTHGKVHITLHKNNSDSIFRKIDNIELHNAFGPHPVGNVSTQIMQIDPINKGEIVWVLQPEDLVMIGEYLETGVLNMDRIVAVNGSQVKNPGYAKTRIGTQIKDILSVFDVAIEDNRIIQGNPICGEQTDEQASLGYYTHQICIIPEGKDYDFFGWNKPQPNKFSVLRANMFSFLTPNKKYKLNANTNGEERAFVLNGVYEDVMPLDIYPIHLLKSCMYKDIDEMEKLGIYEVAPEDFALTEFVCVSKLPHQEILRAGLDLMVKEVG